MDRAEQTGLGIAVAGHVALFGLLSVGFLATPNPSALKSDPIDVQFVDEIGLESAFPEPAIEDPAESVAPELGSPEESAAPIEVIDPAPIVPVPDPAPAPKAVPKAAPKQSQPRPKAQAERPKEKAKARGARLGDDFLKGITDRSTSAKGDTPRAANVGTQAMSGLGAAIRRQIRPCYNLGPLGGTAAMEIVVRVRLRPQPDGSIPRGGFDVVGFTGVNGGNSSYRDRMAEVARNAVLDPRCSPLNLPPELYEGGWEDIIINFIPRDFS